MEFKIKQCCRCGEIKSLNDFHNRNVSKDGVSAHCKICAKMEHKKYRELPENKERLKKQREIQKNEITNYGKIHYLKNKSKISKKRKERREINKIELNERERERYINNKDIIKQQRIERHINNPHIRAWRGCLSSCLRRLNKGKKGKTIDLLGYSALDLKLHLESLFTEGMLWDNHGEWHIDHIIPVNLFDKDAHPSIVNALSNLRPLWATSRTINGVFYEGNLNRC